MTAMEVLGWILVAFLILAVAILILSFVWVKIMLKNQNKINHKDEWGK